MDLAKHTNRPDEFQCFILILYSQYLSVYYTTDTISAKQKRGPGHFGCSHVNESPANCYEHHLVSF